MISAAVKVVTRSHRGEPDYLNGMSTAAARPLSEIARNIAKQIYRGDPEIHHGIYQKQSHLFSRAQFPSYYFFRSSLFPPSFFRNQISPHLLSPPQSHNQRRTRKNITKPSIRNKKKQNTPHIRCNYGRHIDTKNPPPRNNLRRGGSSGAGSQPSQEPAQPSFPALEGTGCGYPLHALNIATPRLNPMEYY